MLIYFHFIPFALLFVNIISFCRWDKEKLRDLPWVPPLEGDKEVNFLDTGS